MPTIISSVELEFQDVLLNDKYTKLISRSQVDLNRKVNFKYAKVNFHGVPIFAANMDTIGTFDMAVAMHKHNMLVAIHKFYSVEEWLEFANKHPEVVETVCVSQGIGQEDVDKIDKILTLIPGIKFICMDVAKGFSESFENAIRATRARYPTKVIMAGNVCTGDGVECLLRAGADIVKVGIGPGSVCETRKKAGVGRSQFSAVLECAEVAHRDGGLITSDGGCKNPGDVAKAFGAGADFVMIGGMFAGHDQCSGRIETDSAGSYKIFYGMSSKHAQEKYCSGLAEYRASEGKKVRVPYRGDIEPTILDILGGLRSACTYTNSARIEDLPHNAEFRCAKQQNNNLYASGEMTQV